MTNPLKTTSSTKQSHRDDILDDLFHGAAFAAFVEEALLAGRAPCPTATKYGAYGYYEQALATKNAAKQIDPINCND